MQVSVSTVSGLERRMEISIPAGRLTGEIESRLRQIARTARLKGFRPGKAPLSVVRQQFSAQVSSEVRVDILREAYAEAVTQQKLRPASDPQIEFLSTDSDPEFRFAARIEVLPEISLAPLPTLFIDNPVAEVTDADVERMLESMRWQRVTYVDHAGPAVSGDKVTLDFDGTIDGLPFKGGSATGVPIVLGRQRLLAEFEDGVVGLSPGEKKSIDVVFPADYHSADVAGKTALFSISLTKCERAVLPEIDESFCQQFGVLEGGIETLRQEVVASMRNELDRARQVRLRREVLQKLLAANPVEVPKTLLSERIARLYREIAARSGNPDPGSLPSPAELEPRAREQIAIELILAELIKTSGVTVDRDRVATRLDSMVEGYPNGDELRRQYLQDPQFMQGLERTVLDEQVIDYVVSKATVIDLPTTFADLTGFDQARAI
jgi:trigger factor